ncbi:MAG: hypothetical protein ACXAB4_04390 [Candidatus Hodarchaeales archaeon]
MTAVLSLIEQEPESRFDDEDSGILCVPFVIRGKVIEDFSIEIERRDRGYGQVVLKTPDLRAYLPKLVDVRPHTLKKLANIPSAEIRNMLHQVGQAFAPGTNKNAHFAPIIEDAIQATAMTSSLSEAAVRFAYDQIPGILNRDVIDYVLEQELGGNKFLDGWVEVNQPAFAMESPISHKAREENIPAKYCMSWRVTCLWSLLSRSCGEGPSNPTISSKCPQMIHTPQLPFCECSQNCFPSIY